MAQLSGAGQFVFDRKTGVVTSGSSEIKVKTGSDGIEATIPLQISFKLKEALTKSEKPEAKQQLAGWRVMRGVKNPTTGDIIYTHIITPVAGADYTIMQNIYDAFPDPMVRQQMYDLYRGAFSQNLGVNSGKVVVDLSK